jgi:hypothetical protein
VTTIMGKRMKRNQNAHERKEDGRRRVLGRDLILQAMRLTMTTAIMTMTMPLGIMAAIRDERWHTSHQ